MSGTSVDGVDAAIVDFASGSARLLGRASAPYADSLRHDLLALNAPGVDELARAARLGVRVAELYAGVVQEAVHSAGLTASAIAAIGCHGQTVRHDPADGYTIQLIDAARLAELTGIDVICDFRSRDIAAGGQGAPLAPGFHAAAFSTPEESRCVLNLGGIANITLLPQTPDRIAGFDTGPANCLMDEWCERHVGGTHDEDGRWAREGRPLDHVLDAMLQDSYFFKPPPKSTGRDHFNLGWLQSHLRGGEAPADIQATLLELTVRSISDAVERYAPDTTAVIACGGGVRNGALMERLALALGSRTLRSSAALGVDPQLVEPIAFAWLARQTMHRLPGNMPSVTGALGPRVLGRVHPA